MKEPTTDIEIEAAAETAMLPLPPPTASPHQALVERLKDYGQEDVFALWDELSPEERDLLTDIENLDLPRIDRIIRCSLQSQGLPVAAIEAVPEDCVSTVEQRTKEDREKWWNLGLRKIYEGKLGVVLLSRGQGTRLGSSDPKGCYNIGLPSGKSLFQIQAERILCVQRLAAQAMNEGPTRPVTIQWYIMTSPYTHEPTQKFFESHKYFGLESDQVTFFQQGTLPCISKDGKFIMETPFSLAKAPDGNGGVYTVSLDPMPKWRKVAYGGMQIGYDDNYTDESFLEEMVMNANVVRRDLLKVMKDSVSITQYLCIVALVVLVWVHTLGSSLDENSLLLLDLSLLASGFLVLLLTEEKMLSLSLLLRYVVNISFFTTGLYILAPIYQTLTRSISSDSIWAVTVSLLLLHLFLHDYSGSTIRAPGALKNPNLMSCISLNASIVASVFVASRLPSRLHVFAVMLFSLQVFLFAPLVTYCIKKFSFGLHLLFSFALMGLTLYSVYALHRLLFVLFLVLVVFVNVVCPYWLIRMQEYKFEINGPWDEAKLCFDITD